MAQGRSEEGEGIRRANELYWGSERSVNAIAGELGLSKGRLYGMIRPLPADPPCPRCGGTLVFENRTARERGEVVCQDCEREDRAQAPDPARTSASPPAKETTAALAGLVVGVAAGILVGRFLRK